MRPYCVGCGEAGLIMYSRLAERYKELHAQGYSKSEAHALAWAEVTEAQEPEPPQDPYMTPIFGRRP